VADRRVWRRILKTLKLTAPAVITHDAAAGLAREARRDGILAICGRGRWRTRGGRTARSDSSAGRGPILGDEGSGFDIGQRGLRAAIRASDGRGQPTLLERLIPERLKLGSLDELVPWVSPFAKDRVASVAPIVFEAEAAGTRGPRDHHGRGGGAGGGQSA